jgi:hypothetical protein
MADFVQTTVNKTALRDLAVPLVDVESFNTLVQAVISDNPFGCVDYTTKDGQTIDGVTLNREHYTAKVNFVDGNGKRLGTVSLLSPTIAGFNANAAEILDNTAIKAAMGATAAVRDTIRETYYAQLKCHDSSGDDYYVTFTRKTVRISSYQDDAIRTTVETWADDVTSLD